MFLTGQLATIHGYDKVCHCNLFISSDVALVLMNLLANGLKFCERGFVSTTCTVDSSIPCGKDEVVLKWVVQ